MKVYIAGPITGVPDYAKRFRQAEEELRKQGHLTMSPHVLAEGFPWAAYMPICYAMMDACDTIFMLQGWEKSKGASMERIRAMERGMGLLYET